MISRKQMWTSLAAATVMMVLIMDARTGLSGAQEGLTLCFHTVIPSLFPFIVISIIINSNLTGCQIPLLRPIGKACGIPQGGEALLVLGLLGGYPVGAQGIVDAHRNGVITKQDARRLLGFCNNAGPAFIFGMLGSLFDKSAVPWMLWGIHILSAILVGCILPEKSKHQCHLSRQPALTVAQSLEKALKTIAVICGWIILFRVLIAFLQRWFLWILPQWLQACIIAFLELSNGCHVLHSMTCQGLRFVLSAGILAFGGLCVYMQTRSVTNELGCGIYFPGKVLQTCISILLAVVSQQFLFSKAEQLTISVPLCVVLILVVLFTILLLHRKKKVVAFSDRLVYNT